MPYSRANRSSDHDPISFSSQGTIGTEGNTQGSEIGTEAREVQILGLGPDEDFQECELTTPLSSKAWVQWTTVVDLAPGVHRVLVRATDGTGETQTREVARPAPDGATGWHGIRVDAV